MLYWLIPPLWLLIPAAIVCAVRDRKRKREQETRVAHEVHDVELFVNKNVSSFSVSDCEAAVRRICVSYNNVGTDTNIGAYVDALKSVYNRYYELGEFPVCLDAHVSVNAPKLHSALRGYVPLRFPGVKN